MTERTRPSLRETKKQEVRRAIALAAADLFEKQGYAETTIEEIAVAAHVSRPTVFNYYANKEAIVPVAFVEAMTDRFEALERLPVPDDPIEAIRATLVHQAEGFADRPETSRAFFVHHMQARKAAAAGGKGTPGDRRAFAEGEEGIGVRGRIAGRICAFLAKGQESGRIRQDFTPEELSHHLFVGFFASTIGPWLWGHLGDRPLPEIVARHFDFYVTGLVGS